MNRRWLQPCTLGKLFSSHCCKREKKKRKKKTPFELVKKIDKRSFASSLPLNFDNDPRNNVT
jgi:hypothetical protein